ncbi:MAG: hypothetical protein ACKVS6_04480 [Planctomycetota bacterium]
MSEELFATKPAALDEPKAAVPSAASAGGVEDLFDFGGGDRRPGDPSHATDKPAEKPAAAQARNVESLLLETAAVRTAGASAAWHRSPAVWFAAAVLVNISVVIFIMMRFEAQTERIVQSTRSADGAAERNTPIITAPEIAHPAGEEPRNSKIHDNVTNSESPVSNHSETTSPAKAPVVVDKTPDAKLVEADSLLQRGFLEQARKKYYEVLIQLRPGERGVLDEQSARLGIARSVARMGAPVTSPISLRYSLELLKTEHAEAGRK